MAGCYLRLAVRVLRAHGEHPVRRMFRLSILNLFVLFAALIVERASTMAIARPAGAGTTAISATLIFTTR